MNYYIYILYALLVFTGCSRNKEFPIWKISKDDIPTSYLMASTEYLTKEEVNERLSDRIIAFFDSCKTYVSFWDLTHSKLSETSSLIENDSGKFLSETMPHDLYTSFKTQLSNIYHEKLPIDSIKMKPQFLLFDVLNKKPETAYSIDNMWFKKAMPSFKNLEGVITFQDYYKSLNMPFIKTLQELLAKDSIHNLKTNILNDQTRLWSSDDVKNIKNYTHPNDIYFTSINEKNRYYEWFNQSVADNICLHLNKNSCFINLDAYYLFGKNNIRDFLLLKGYQVTQLN